MCVRLLVDDFIVVSDWLHQGETRELGYNELLIPVPDPPEAPAGMKRNEEG